MSEPNLAQAHLWNGSVGQGWAANQAMLDRHFGPLTVVGLEALAPRPGERIVDVGCGCGGATLVLAERVGAEGEVLGADISAPMLETARRRAAAARLAQTRFVTADAQTFDFGAGRWDGVFSQLGVMFFAAPAVAFANLRAALRPGGRLAFVCWRSAAENELIEVAEAVLQRLPPHSRTVAPPGAPGAFALADQDRTHRILSSAGYRDITLTPHDMPIGSPTLEEAVEVTTLIGPLGSVLRDNPALLPEAREAAHEVLAGYRGPDGVVTSAAIWIVVARA